MRWCGGAGAFCLAIIALTRGEPVNAGWLVVARCASIAQRIGSTGFSLPRRFSSSMRPADAGALSQRQLVRCRLSVLFCSWPR